MIKPNYVKARPEMFHYFRSRMVFNKLTVLILSIVVLFFIIYEMLYFQNQNRPTILTSLSNSFATKPESPSRTYSYVYHDPLVPNFVEKIVDKAKPPATCLLVIRDADGGTGNRMFLFASAYGLARLHQCDLYVAPYIIRDLQAIFVVNLTNTPVHLITDESVVNQTNLTRRYSACTLYEDLLRVPLTENLTKYELNGFYQAFGYFVKYKHEVNYLYQFNQGSIEKNVDLVEQLVKGR